MGAQVKESCCTQCAAVVKEFADANADFEDRQRCDGRNNVLQLIHLRESAL